MAELFSTLSPASVSVYNSISNGHDWWLSNYSFEFLNPKFADWARKVRIGSLNYKIHVSTLYIKKL